MHSAWEKSQWFTSCTIWSGSCWSLKKLDFPNLSNSNWIRSSAWKKYFVTVEFKTILPHPCATSLLHSCLYRSELMDIGALTTSNSELMDRSIIRIFLEVLGVFSLLKVYSCSSCWPPCLFTQPWWVNQSYKTFQGCHWKSRWGGKSSEINCGHF